MTPHPKDPWVVGKQPWQASADRDVISSSLGSNMSKVGCKQAPQHIKWLHCQRSSSHDRQKNTGNACARPEPVLPECGMMMTCHSSRPAQPRCEPSASNAHAVGHDNGLSGEQQHMPAASASPQAGWLNTCMEQLKPVQVQPRPLLPQAQVGKGDSYNTERDTDAPSPRKRVRQVYGIALQPLAQAANDDTSGHTAACIDGCDVTMQAGPTIRTAMLPLSHLPSFCFIHNAASSSVTALTSSRTRPDQSDDQSAGQHSAIILDVPSGHGSSKDAVTATGAARADDSTKPAKQRRLNRRERKQKRRLQAQQEASELSAPALLPTPWGTDIGRRLVPVAVAVPPAPSLELQGSPDPLYAFVLQAVEALMHAVDVQNSLVHAYGEQRIAQGQPLAAAGCGPLARSTMQLGAGQHQPQRSATASSSALSRAHALACSQRCMHMAPSCLLAAQSGGAQMAAAVAAGSGGKASAVASRLHLGPANNWLEVRHGPLVGCPLGPLPA